jgi:hypothetical protein
VELKLTDTSRLSVADDSHTTIKSGSEKGITIGLQLADIVIARAQFVAASLNPTEIKKIWGAKGKISSSSLTTCASVMSRIVQWEPLIKKQQASEGETKCQIQQGSADKPDTQPRHINAPSPSPQVLITKTIPATICNTVEAANIHYQSKAGFIA